MATKDRTSLKNEFKNGNLATGERFADLIDSVKVVQLPVVDPQALGSTSSFIDSISQDADGKITATKKNVVLNYVNIQDKPQINGHTLSGDMSLKELGIINQIHLNDGTAIYPDQDGNVKLPVIPQTTNTITPGSTNVPTADAVDEALEEQNLLVPKANPYTAAQKYNVSANINDRSAVVAQVTGEVQALGYKVLNPNASFASQVVDENTVYEIRDEFVLNTTITIPANCTLKFNGGRIVGGVINLNGAKLTGEILITSEPAINANNPADEVYKPYNKEIKVSWFGAVGDGVTDDSAALTRVVKWSHRDGATIIFDKNATYLHGDGVQDLENDPDMTLHTGYSYSRLGNVPDTDDYIKPAIGDGHPANIGRDITLRFLGYKNLNIVGNGATILSNPANGICKHNIILWFGACKDCTVEGLNVDGNRLNRVTNAGVQFGDWSNGSFGGYTGSVYDNWINNVWVDSPTAGYGVRSSIYLYGCQNVVFRNISSVRSLMDGLMVNKCQDSTNLDNYSSNIVVEDSYFDYNARTAIDAGQCVDLIVRGCKILNTGYFENGEEDGVSSKNMSGISSELESEPVNLGIPNRLLIEKCYFSGSVQRGIGFSTGTKNSVVRQCTFWRDSLGLINQTVASDSWKFCSGNIVEGCTFYNSSANIYQDGAVIRNNKFVFDKDSTRVLAAYTPTDFESYNVVTPVVFENNTVDVSLQGMTVDYDGTTYINYDLAKVGSIRFKGRIRVIGNKFHNLLSSYKSGNFFAGACEIKAIECRDNSFENDYCYLSYTVNETRYYNGIIRVNIAPYNKVNGTSVRNNTLVNLSIGSIDEYNASGDTLDRPSLNNRNESGLFYFDETLGKIIVSKLEVSDTYLDKYTGNTNDPNWINITNKYTAGTVVFIKASRLDSQRTTPVIRFVKTNTSKNGIDLPLVMSKSFYSAYCVVSIPDSTYKYLYVEPNKKSGTTGIDVYVYPTSMSWVDTDGYPANKKVGGTADRPPLTSKEIGYFYYDTTLGKPIYWNGTAWVDGNGNLLSEIQVSDRSVLLQAAANSSNVVEVYTSDAPSIAVKNPDNTTATWMTATLSGTELTITATSANTIIVAPEWAENTYFSESGGEYTLLTSEPANWETNYADYYTEEDGVHSAVEGVVAPATSPRGGKVILTNTNDEVVINVIQSY